jgi:hypothetical protein
MKVIVCGLCVLAAFECMQAQAKVWQPSAGHAQILVWPGKPPDALPPRDPNTP